MQPRFRPDGDRPGYLYAQFADYLAARISDGTLQPGAQLLAERDLAAQHRVSIGTVRRTAQELRERGLIITLPAKGTFVAANTTTSSGAGGGSAPESRQP